MKDCLCQAFDALKDHSTGYLGPERIAMAINQLEFATEVQTRAKKLAQMLKVCLSIA